AAIGVEQARDDPAARAVGILHQAPALHQPNDLYRQPLPTIDPFDRIGLARADAHVHFLGTERRPIRHFTILRGGRRSGGYEDEGGEGEKSARRPVPTPSEPDASTGFHALSSPPCKASTV